MEESSADLIGNLHAVDAAEGFHKLVQLLPAMVCIWQAGELHFVSLPAEDLTGYSTAELLAMDFSQLVAEEDRSFFQGECRSAMQGGGKRKPCELQLATKSGKVKWVDFSATTIVYRGETALLGKFEDATERKTAEDALRESEKRFRLLFRNAKVGMSIDDCAGDGRISEVNPAYEKMLGYEPGELIGKRFQDITHADDVDKDQALYHEMLAGKRQRYSIEKRYIHKNGKTVWGSLNLFLVRGADGRPGHTFAVVQNITQFKKVQQKLLAEERLLRQLLDLQDKERRLVSCEIHDGLVQDLFASLMMLQSLQSQYDSAGRVVPEDLVMAQQYLERAQAEGRRLMEELRPMIIEEMGIVDTIRAVIDREHTRNQIDIGFECRVRFARLQPLLEGTLYRIVAECINNARRHSNTDRIEIRLTQVDDNHVVLEVQDFGVGFDVAKIPEDRFGIEGIRERARLFGGGATIESSPGNGTRITVKLPFGIHSSQPRIEWTV